MADAHAIRMISNGGIATTIAGSKYRAHLDGRGDEARFGYPTSMVLTASDVLILPVR